ncbi:MAG: hypothetical protein IJU19_03120 [Bacteroidales bacterium]|nr:hypothetical protein [Bacteroidales bacterium]
MAKKVSAKKAAAEAQEAQVILRPEVDQAIEKRLVALYTLQCVDSEIDKIRIIRGELPQAVQDLEDEVAGLDTRIENYTAEIKETEAAIKARNAEIVDHGEQIKKYQKQQENVRNNREYESLNKEVEFQTLEIELCERKNKEGQAHVKELKQHIEAAKLLKENRLKDLDAKREELTSITAETEKDEARLAEKSKEQAQYIDDRYLAGYKRIRESARNGLAVVQIDRGSCGGCFSSIPPQRQMEIKMHKKVIVCENCGRILVDDDIAAKAKAHLES